jgi:mannose-6-phosphate isomerase
MLSKPDYPLRFQPIYKERIWGGDMRSIRPDAPGAPRRIGESWEISDRAEENSVVSNGPLAGTTLGELIARHPQSILGPAGAPRQRFPLLVKFIRTGEKCSLQVHPPDDYARREHPGESGKTEMWYILDADPQASLLIGFQRPQTLAEVRRAIEENRLENLVRHTPVRQGEAFFLPAGRIHGIGEGILLAEIQDNSDLTYRVYDYGRQDAQGRPRDLHLEQALAVMKFSDTSDGRIAPVKTQTGSAVVWPLVTDSHFRCEHTSYTQAQAGPIHQGFQVLLVTEGAGRLTSAKSSELLTRGTVLLLPAGFSGWALEPESAPLGVLYAWIGDRR